MKSFITGILFIISLQVNSQCICIGGFFNGIEVTDTITSLACTIGGGTVDCSLPVELEVFTGINKDNINIINWVTASETNNKYFFLYRGRNDGSWVEIAVINGAGTVHTPTFYEYRDDSYLPGTNYYRLGQIDFDGTSKIFHTISIDNRIDHPKGSKKAYDILGREVPLNYKGYKIVVGN